MRLLATAAAITVIFLAAQPASASMGPDSAVANALTRPAKDALRAIDSLAKAQRAPAGTRAQSLRILGDYQFIKEEYKKAADFYQQAMRLDSASAIYKELYELTVTLTGGNAETPVSVPPAAPVSTQQAAPASTPPAAPVSTQQATPASTQQTAAVSATPPAAPPSAQAQQPAPKPKAAFTIQVGAFGSRENADNLVKRLTGTYNDITVSPTTSGDQTLYRVRVGSFVRREDADTLLHRLTTTAGLSARVVEK